jgi:hypothetical protein
MVFHAIEIPRKHASVMAGIDSKCGLSVGLGGVQPLTLGALASAEITSLSLVDWIIPANTLMSAPATLKIRGVGDPSGCRFHPSGKEWICRMGGLVSDCFQYQRVQSRCGEESSVSSLRSFVSNDCRLVSICRWTRKRRKFQRLYESWD